MPGRRRSKSKSRPKSKPNKSPTPTTVVGAAPNRTLRSTLPALKATVKHLYEQGELSLNDAKSWAAAYGRYDQDFKFYAQDLELANELRLIAYYLVADASSHYLQLGKKVLQFYSDFKNLVLQPHVNVPLALFALQLFAPHYRRLSFVGSRLAQPPKEFFDLSPQTAAAFKEIPYQNLTDGLRILAPHFPDLQDLSLRLAGPNLFPPGQLPPAIAEFTDLRSLEVENCGILWIPVFLENLVELKTLSLPNNNIKHIPRTLAALPKLEDLNLSSNDFMTIPPILCKLPALRRLYMQDNPGGAEMEIPACLQALRGRGRLQELRR